MKKGFKTTKQFEVTVGFKNVIYVMNEERLRSFTDELLDDHIPFVVKEITEYIDRCGKWYITFKTGETRYCDTELEMYKTLYYTTKPVDCYGNIF